MSSAVLEQLDKMNKPSQKIEQFHSVSILFRDFSQLPAECIILSLIGAPIVERSINRVFR